MDGRVVVVCVCVCGGAAWREARMAQWSPLSIRALVPLQGGTEGLSLRQLDLTLPGKGLTLHTDTERLSTVICRHRPLQLT